MHFVRFASLLLLLVFAPGRGNAVALEFAPLRYPIDGHPGAYIPYAASHSISDANRGITRILFSIHSSGFDALQYYENARRAAAKVPGATQQTLIIAPQFFEQKAIPGAIPSGLMFWRVSPYRGSGRAAIGPEVKPVSLSAYAIIDEWIERLVASGQFPRLRDVVLVGHSAGGQLVQRYAMVGKYQPADGLQMRYVVSAPSSYAYSSSERYHQGQKRFIEPDAATIKDCPGYNQWGYGLDKPYGYFANEDLAKIAKAFADKRVFYLCGSKDNDPNDPSLGKNCGAMMQGAHRRERMLVYKSFLEFKYGKSVAKNHKFAVIPNVGHHGLGTMTSVPGVHALFAPIR